MRFDFEVVFIGKALYEILSDKTMIYPGHGKFTDIGSGLHIRTGGSLLSPGSC
jgi:hypothetical protein